MESVLDEISKLRKNASLTADHENSNRYRILANESDGSKTAYYFSTPIYNHRSKNLVDLKFYPEEKTIHATGSNATISINEQIRMENANGTCILSLSGPKTLLSDHELICGNLRIYPTTNGIAIRSFFENSKSYEFTVEISKPNLDVQSNDKFFALMNEAFKPFVTVSCIGTSNASGAIIAPARLTYQKITDRRYGITVFPYSTLGSSLLMEINLYEAKLFQDTTVESKHPNLNNAFGSTAFLGVSQEFGEQWLYTRPDFSKLADLSDKKILRAILHLPKFHPCIYLLPILGLLSHQQ